MAENKINDSVRKYLSEIGRTGGEVTGVPKGFGSLTDEEKKVNAKRAAEARWAKHRKAKKAESISSQK